MNVVVEQDMNPKDGTSGGLPPAVLNLVSIRHGYMLMGSREPTPHFDRHSVAGSEIWGTKSGSSGGRWDGAGLRFLGEFSSECECECLPLH